MPSFHSPPVLGRVEHESDIDDELPGKAENRGDEEGVGGIQVLELSCTHADGSGAACCRRHYEEGLCEASNPVLWLYRNGGPWF